MHNEKITRREINFPTYKTRFFFFGPLLLSNFITFFYFLFILYDFKWYRSATWSFTNHLETLITIEQHTRNFVSVWEPTFVAFDGLFFWIFDNLYFEGLEFNFIPFLTIFSALNMPIRGVQVLFKHQKQWSPPLGSSLF
jgi:hypothetical protein